MTGYPRFTVIFFMVVTVLLLAVYAFDSWITRVAWRSGDPEQIAQLYRSELKQRGYLIQWREAYGLDPIWEPFITGGVLIGTLFVICSVFYFLLRPRRRRPIRRQPYQR